MQSSFDSVKTTIWAFNICTFLESSSNRPSVRIELMFQWTEIKPFWLKGDPLLKSRQIDWGCSSDSEKQKLASKSLWLSSKSNSVSLSSAPITKKIFDHHYKIWALHKNLSTQMTWQLHKTLITFYEYDDDENRKTEKERGKKQNEIWGEWSGNDQGSGNPAYGRHWISRPMRIIGPMIFNL